MSAHTHARQGRIARLTARFRHDDARPPRPSVSVGMPGFEVPAYLPGPPFAGGTPRSPQAEASPVHMCPDAGNVMPCCLLTPDEVPRTDRVTMRPELVTCRDMAGEEPHGIAAPETLAGIVAQAEAEARAASIPPDEPQEPWDAFTARLAAKTAPWGAWDRPDGDVPHSEPEVPLAEEHQRFYGWGTTLPDNRAPKARPYVPSPLDCPYVPGPADLRTDICQLPALRDAIRWAARQQHAGCMCEPADDAWLGWFAGQYAHIIPAEPAVRWWTARPVQADEAATAEMEAAA
jgi:hypothetical protein